MEILFVTEKAPPVEMILIERLLADHDVGTRAVKSYKQAIEYLAKHKYRIVILYCFDSHDDFKTTEAVRIMKEIVPNLLIIAISGETPLETERELRKSGLYFHLSSPIDEKELKEVLLGAIKKEKSRRQQ